MKRMNSINFEDLPPDVKNKCKEMTTTITEDLPVDARYAILGKVFVLVSTLTQGDARWVCQEVLRHLTGRGERRGGYHPKHKHTWAIESPNGKTSYGICKECGATKEFYNSIETVMDGKHDQ